MSFCISSVPEERWVSIEFDLLLDFEEIKTYTIDLKFAVKSPDELHKLHKEVLESVKKDATNGKDIMPSDDVQMRFVKRLLLDWAKVEVQTANEQTKALEYNENNFARMVNIPEARVAIYEAALRQSNRKDLLEKN